MKTVKKLGKISVTIGRVVSVSLVYCLLGVWKSPCCTSVVVFGEKQAGLKGVAAAVQYGFYPIECQPLQQLYRSSALCRSGGSCQERGANGGKRGLVYKVGSPLE